MSSWAKSRSRLVYAPQGPGAKQSDKPEKQNVGPTCRHGGVIVMGIEACGICNPEAMGFALVHLARKVSRQFRGLNPSDVEGAVALALFLQAAEIQRADNPTALANTIAFCAGRKLYRAPGGITADEAVESTPEKLGALGKVARYEMAESWRAKCYAAMETFPGLPNVLRNPANYQLIEEAIAEARDSLPTEPVDVWLVVDLRTGYSGLRERNFTEIAKMVSVGGQRITPREVGRAYKDGLAAIKEHIVRRLLPLTTKAPDA